jgi:hypothetical protein
MPGGFADPLAVLCKTGQTAVVMFGDTTATRMHQPGNDTPDGAARMQLLEAWLCECHINAANTLMRMCAAPQPTSGLMRWRYALPQRPKSACNGTAKHSSSKSTMSVSCVKAAKLAQ